eukprot:CAMPEP_0182452330 /NCGR_PEP_ID=MMETSP1172-20130603/44192_1 /TAXON_ID=708627 /ORGANISM="Timspurckia oligopyrenoides, Strain CCMP3278" /LENGTH=455 /DNA_ID=CAMNT_0024650157 /DNA_START=1346 /DNA_END=2716 /DNA_ORIENTATION=-
MDEISFEIEEVREEHKRLYQPSVWLEMAQLMSWRGNEVINLGQGYPDWNPPQFVTKAACQAVDGNSSERSVYTRTRGYPPLLNAIAKHYSVSLNRHLDPAKHIVVSVGASQAISIAMSCFLKPGDEVILIEPFFDLYRGSADIAGATIRSVPLRVKSSNASQLSSDQLQIDFDELESVFNKNTRMLVLNSPHNPTGKMFSRDEYIRLSQVLNKYPRVLVLSDEVYEHIIFEAETQPHVPFASISEAMWNRTISIYSAGKTFSVTGWKVGWMIAPAEIISRLVHLQQWIVFCVSTPLQAAVAECLEFAEQPFDGFLNYYQWLANEYKVRRELLVEALRSAEMVPMIPQGAFFVMADTQKLGFVGDTFPLELQALIDEGKLDIDQSTLNRRDYNLGRNLLIQARVSAIPPSAFYSDGNKFMADNQLRFAFCKSLPALEEAQRRFQDLMTIESRNSTE